MIFYIPQYWIHHEISFAVEIIPCRFRLTLAQFVHVSISRKYNVQNGWKALWQSSSSSYQIIKEMTSNESMKLEETCIIMLFWCVLIGKYDWCMCCLMYCLWSEMTSNLENSWRLEYANGFDYLNLNLNGLVWRLGVMLINWSTSIWCSFHVLFICIIEKKKLSNTINSVCISLLPNIWVKLQTNVDVSLKCIYMHHVCEMCIIFTGRELAHFSIWLAMAFNPQTANLTTAALFYEDKKTFHKRETLSIVNVDGTVGRYIIVRADRYKRLSLCEVEVYTVGAYFVHLWV